MNDSIQQKEVPMQTDAPKQTETPQQTEVAQVLSEIECRVLGALMEKQLSTPDNYPLTISGLLSAVNQKSNREPVTNYQQGEIVRTLRMLEERRFVRYEMGARSERYEQSFTSANGFSKKQQALLSVLMLRGPQTVNELQTRTQRLYEYSDRDDMVVSLERLTQGETPAAVLIPRQSGQRDDRYGHVLCGEVALSSSAVATSEKRPSSRSEIDALKCEVKLLREQLSALYVLTGHKPVS